jgi:cellulose synthase/poly-beta-1,6-N-acetylglucosamine synthase-like glycosyltransferase
MVLVFDVLGSIPIILATLGLVASCVFTLATLWLIALHLKLRQSGLEREQQILALALPSDGDLPHVVVQIPCFNEGAIVARALRHAASLDWPREKLHIQLLDDSTESAAPQTIDEVAALQASGVDVAVLRRSNRDDFKAGALRHGMELSGHDYFAILDVDYVPQPDFLKKVMRGFVADPSLAFVQARFDFLNSDENALTRAQRLLLDAHLGVEQATRSWALHPLPFNGTCGVWHRSAIEAAGGWRGETLAEDLDLSYRALKIGRRGLFFVTVAVKGELPSDLSSWSSQQRRWTKGFGQVARALLPKVIRDEHLKGTDRFGALLHLGAWWGPPVGLISAGLSVLAMLLSPTVTVWLLPMLLLVNAIGIGTTLLFLRTGNTFIRGSSSSFSAFLRDVGTVATLGIRVVLVNAAAYRETLQGRSSSFVRTPKRGG